MIRQVFKQFNLGVTYGKSVAQKLQNEKDLALKRVLNGFVTLHYAKFNNFNLMLLACVFTEKGFSYVNH